MNYNDSILENKLFNFVKKLFYNIIISVCVLLFVALILVYGFKFRPYRVLTGSMTPVYCEGDIVVVKAQKSYNIGDTIKFDQNGYPVTHRIVAIVTNPNDNKTYYICHGDALRHVDGTPSGEWQYDADYLKDMSYDEIKNLDSAEVQFVTLNQIEGKVVIGLRRWGSYLSYISEHKLMFISMIIAIWCVSASVQNELEIGKYRRMFS